MAEPLPQWFPVAWHPAIANPESKTGLKKCCFFGSSNQSASPSFTYPLLP